MTLTKASPTDEPIDEVCSLLFETRDAKVGLDTYWVPYVLSAFIGASRLGLSPQSVYLPVRRRYSSTMVQVQAMQTRVTRNRLEAARIEKQTLDRAIVVEEPQSTVMQAVVQQQSFELVQTLLMSSVFEKIFLFFSPGMNQLIMSCCSWPTSPT